MTETRMLSATFGLLAVLVLLTGCTLPAAPDVTPTPSMEEGMAMEATETWAGATETAAASPTSVELSPTPTTPPTAPVTATVEPTTVAAVTPTAQPTQVSGEQTYVVQSGDNLFRIARRYGMHFEDLAAYNGIVNPHRIRVGQVVRIPGGQVTTTPSGGETRYTVQTGDNLFRIALRYNMSYLYLASYNGISNPHMIQVGQVIRIPTLP